MTNFIYKKLVLFCLLLPAGRLAMAQTYTISGPTCVLSGAQYSYTLSGAYPGNPYMYAIINGGYILGGTSNTVNVMWSGPYPGTYNYNLYVYYTPPFPHIDVNVAAVGNITAGAFNITNNQVASVAITGDATTAGSCLFNYQWESGGSYFSPIAGATGKDYTLSGNTSSVLTLRRKVYATGDEAHAQYSNTLSFQALTALNGANAGVLAPAALAGCSSSATYSWQVSSDGATWADLLSGGSLYTGATYNPGVLGATTYYRVKVTCGSTSATTVFKVTIVQPLAGGTVTPPAAAVPFGGAPDVIASAQAATGGACGSYAYQWEKSANGISFDPVTYAGDAAAYYPEFLYGTAYFRRRVDCGGQSAYSNIISITPLPDVLRGGTISMQSAFLYSAVNSFAIASVNGASGGCWNAAYTYQWQKSADNVTFTDIAGATGASYNTGAIDNTTYYRRKVTCGGNTAYSNVAYIKKADTENYIKEQTARKGGMPDALGDYTDDPSVARQAAQYFDGLGRLIQTVEKRGSMVTGQSATDLVTIKDYDALGRETYQYLPFASTGSDGSLKLNPLVQQKSFYTTLLSGEPGEAVNNPDDANWSFTKTEFESSPLARVKETFAPGTSWAGTGSATTPAARHSSKLAYWSNTDIDAVRVWKVTDVTGGWATYSSAGVYTQGALYKNLITDEDGKPVIEFKDKEGNVILKKAGLTASDVGAGSAHDGWLCTYYVYDNLNRLRCAIQPEGVKALAANSWAFTTAILDEQCFRYEYDLRGRVVRKKLPGAGLEEMVYDTRDRLVMSRNAQQAQAGQWLVLLYDNLNRRVQSGLWSEAHNQAWHAAMVTALDYPFSSAATPAAGYEMLSATGYDNYVAIPSASGLTAAFDNSFSPYLISSYNVAPDFAQPVTTGAFARGKVTWTTTKVLKSSPAVYIYTVNLYDERGRLVQAKTKNHTGGSDISTTQYSWTDQPLVTVLQRQSGAFPVQTAITVTTTTYDNLGRVSAVKKRVQHTQVNSNNMSQPVTLAEMSYNALGQVKSRQLGRQKDVSGVYLTTPLESVDYDYNIRGWLLGANRKYVSGTNNDRHFGFALGYDKLPNHSGRNFSTAQYNGGINGMVWKSAGNSILRKYDFTYDAANRLMNSAFEQLNDDALWNSNKVNYTLTMGDGVDPNTAYDANGNIKKQRRWGLKAGSSVQIDNMVYSYLPNSNRLSAIAETGSGTTDHKLGDFTDGNTSGDDFSYDLNGNVTADLNKRLSGIAYNHLNLPEQVTVKNAAGTVTGTVAYAYDADGKKLTKTVTDNSLAGRTITTTTQYLGETVYETRTNTAVAAESYTNQLQYIGHEEGRVRFMPAVSSIPAAFAFDYFLKDHLGNIRMVLTDERQSGIYRATMETAVRADEVALFGDKISTTAVAKPAGFDSDAGNGVVSIVNGTTAERRVGPGVILKVMAGDQVNAGTFAWYLPTGMDNTVDATLPGIVNNLLTQLTSGIAGAAKGGAAVGVTGTTLQPGMETFLGTQTVNSGAPKAYLNWVLLDEEQYKAVANGFTQVPAISGTQQKQVLQANNGNNINITRNGYLYVYVSNESKGNVYFDEIRVEHIRGSLLEEAHYYPFGLTMNGIGSAAIGKLPNKFTYTGKELQNRELADGSGLEWLDFGARMYDPQIGRWHVQDAVADKFHACSPYSYVTNSPLKIVDPDGNDWFTYNGDIMWDDSRDQTLEKEGHKWKNIGNTLTITTTSYINTPNDLPVPEKMSEVGAGDKLTTTITITGNYDKNNTFGGFTVDYNRKIGATFNIEALKGVEVPGEKNTMLGIRYWDGKSPLQIAAHVTTPPVETFGLRLVGSNVDVNQELNITLNKGRLNIDITHGTYPSVKMGIHGTNSQDFNWYQYQQQSFIQSHATRFWTVTMPFWQYAPGFFWRMRQRQNEAQRNYVELNKYYQNYNKVGTTTLNDWQY